MTDLNLFDDSPLINDDRDMIVQQVDMLFDTNKREVFGAPEYGSQYDEFLFNTQLSNDAIEYRIMSDLAQLELFGFVPECSVNIMEGTLNDIILVTIGLHRNSEYYEKTYRLG